MHVLLGCFILQKNISYPSKLGKIWCQILQNITSATFFRKKKIRTEIAHRGHFFDFFPFSKLFAYLPEKLSTKVDTVDGGLLR